MLCTTCSKKVHPIVALDIDGTLGDYHGHFLNFAEAYLNAQPRSYHEDYDGIGHFRDWFCETYGVDLTTFRQIKLAYRQGAQKRTMPVFMGSSMLTDTLRLMGVEVWLTTTRPYLRLDGIDHDTRNWLSRHGITYDRLMYDENKYDVLASHVDPRRIVAILDDEPEQYDNAERAVGHPVAMLRGTRYNRAVERPNKVMDLASAQDAIAQKVLAWRVRYGIER